MTGLIKEALAVGNQQTERDVVEEALREYIQRRKQLMVMDLFGTIDYDEDCGHNTGIEWTDRTNNLY